MDTINKDFPHLNKKESAILRRFSGNLDNTDVVLRLVNNLYGKFIVSSDSRSRERSRLKLLDMAGLNRLIPADKLYGSIPELELPLNPYISNSLNDYLTGEYLPLALATHPKFFNLCSLHVDRNDTLITLLKKTDKSGNPCVRSIKFLPDFKKLSPDYASLSATSESITRTIYLSTHFENQSRDPVSILYDLVQQADFLFHVHNEEGLIIKEIAKVRMNVRACIFALEVFDFLYLEAARQGEVKIRDGVLQACKENEITEGIKCYLNYIKTSLIDQGRSRITTESEIDKAMADQVWGKIASVRDYQAFRII